MAARWLESTRVYLSHEQTSQTAWYDHLISLGFALSFAPIQYSLLKLPRPILASSRRLITQCVFCPSVDCGCMCVCLRDKDHPFDKMGALWKVIEWSEQWKWEGECPAEINDTLPLSHSIQTVTGKHSDKGTVSSFVCSESTLFILFNAWFYHVCVYLSHCGDRGLQQGQPQQPIGAASGQGRNITR